MQSEIIGAGHLKLPRPSENSLPQYDIAPVRSRSLTRQAVRLPSIEQTNKRRHANWDYSFVAGYLLEVIMWLSEDENQLRRDLQSVASDLRWSAVELLRLEKQLRLAGNDVDAEAVLRLCALFQGDEERLAGYAEEVKAKIITRTKAQKAH